MFGRSGAVRSKILRAVKHVLGAAVLAIGIATFMAATAETAQACPSGKKAPDSISTAPKIGHYMAFKATISAAAYVKDVAGKADGPCCGGGSHLHGIGCAIGCCFACSAAVDAFGPGFVMQGEAICQIPSDQSTIVSTKPPPIFRPPRSFA